jgi:predicted  nucleic acid-binding Zn-ribbon protein
MRTDIVELVVDATYHLEPRRERSRTLSLGPSAMAEMQERMNKLRNEMSALGVEQKELYAEWSKTQTSLVLPEDIRCFLEELIRNEIGHMRNVMKGMRSQLTETSTRWRAAAAKENNRRI